MPTIFKNITDLPVGVTINGTDVFEMVHNGTNVQVTANTVAAALGGGGGGQVVTYSGTYPSAAPLNTNNPAIAYSANGSASVWFWNTSTQAWM